MNLKGIKANSALHQLLVRVQLVENGFTMMGGTKKKVAVSKDGTKFTWNNKNDGVARLHNVHEC